MTKEKMSVYKALCELKILGNRINSAIADGKFCATNKHTNQKISGIPVDRYAKEVIEADFNKVNDLIRRERAIRRAVTRSNAATTVEICGETFTIAEAIEQHQRGNDQLNLLLTKLKNQRAAATKALAYNDSDKLEDEATNYVAMMFGNKESKVSNEQIEGLKKQYKEAQQVDFIDPIHIDEEIKGLEEHIAQYSADFDAALSVSNATTIIEIEY